MPPPFLGLVVPELWQSPSVATGPSGVRGSPSTTSCGWILQWLGGVVLIAWLFPRWVSEGFPCGWGRSGLCYGSCCCFYFWGIALPAGVRKGR